MYNEMIDQLCNLTIDKELRWQTIDNLIVDGRPYSQHFQHILPNKSFFTEYNGKEIVVLYGEMGGLFDDQIIGQYLIQEISGNQIYQLEVPEQNIVKLHTIITLS